MKYLKLYEDFGGNNNNKLYKNNISESIIVPKNMDDLIDELIRETPNTIEEANKISSKYNVDIVTYEEFKDSIKHDEKFLKTLPPERYIITWDSGLYFAVVNKHTDSINLVVNYKLFIKFIQQNFGSDILKSILGHEYIHTQQLSRSGKDNHNIDANPFTEPNKYFSDKKEVMAFAFSVIDELKRKNLSKNEVSKIISMMNGQAHPILDIYKKLKDRKIVNRFKKYLYLYLEELFK